MPDEKLLDRNALLINLDIAENNTQPGCFWTNWAIQ